MLQSSFSSFHPEPAHIPLHCQLLRLGMALTGCSHAVMSSFSPITTHAVWPGTVRGLLGVVVTQLIGFPDVFSRFLFNDTLTEQWEYVR